MVLGPALEGELLVLQEEATPWGCLEEGQVKLRIACFVFTPASQGGGLSFWLEGKILRPMDELRGWSLREDSVVQLGVL